MTSKILAFLLLSASMANADDRRSSSADDLDAATSSEREAATREHYHAQLTTIAERDIVTAQIVRDMALKQWEAAVHARDNGEAGQWATRLAMALRDERDAQTRAADQARERDQARADFEVSAAQVRRLSARASR